MVWTSVAEWLWYAILGFNLGSIAACWYIMWRTYTHGQALIEQYYAYEQEQLERWRHAYRRLAQDDGLYTREDED